MMTSSVCFWFSIAFSRSATASFRLPIALQTGERSNSALSFCSIERSSFSIKLTNPLISAGSFSQLAKMAVNFAMTLVSRSVTSGSTLSKVSSFVCHQENVLWSCFINCGIIANGISAPQKVWSANRTIGVGASGSLSLNSLKNSRSKASPSSIDVRIPTTSEPLQPQISILMWATQFSFRSSQWWS